MTLLETAVPDAWAELERSVYAALETYSNVHRGTGQHSIVSTALYERARQIVLEHLDLDPERHVVIFGSPWRAELLRAELDPASVRVVSSRALGLPLGLRALAVERDALPGGVPVQTGGDAVELVMPRAVVWAQAPYRFEAGTPSIVNAVTLAKALRSGIHPAEAGLSPHKELSPEAARAAASNLLHDDRLPASGRALLHALRRTLIGRDSRVPTSAGPRRYVNLDHGASTPTFQPIWDAVRRVWRAPQAVQREIVRQSAEIVAGFLGAPLDEYEVLFCSNTTEALNLAALNLSALNLAASNRAHAEPNVEPVVLNTEMEHHSNELPWRYVRGASLVRLPVDGEGFLNRTELEHTLRSYNVLHEHGRRRVRLVAVSGASNVLGSFNDLRPIGKLAHRYGAQFLVDGAQLVAHRRVDVERDEIDYLAFSGHKLYAPFGSGALVARRSRVALNPFVLSAIRASGEENAAGIAALAKAMALLQRIGMDLVEAEERVLTRRTLGGLAGIRVGGEAAFRVYGACDPDAPGLDDKGPVIVFESVTTPHNLVAKELGERAGIGVRDGCFCAHEIVRELIHIHPIRTWIGAAGLHLAPAFFRTILPGVVRVSLGLENEARDVEALIEALAEIARAPRSWPNQVIASTHNGTWMLPHTATEDEIAAYAANCAERVYSAS
jgi:selenocysteine lyase/cysteine desulfurase